jgi:hypothetical protein
MDDRQAMRERIEAYLLADSDRQITEAGEQLFDLRQSKFSLEQAHGHLLLHLWSQERNWVRRVLGVLEENPKRLVLAVERFGQCRPGRLVIAAPGPHARLERERQLARRAYLGFFRRLLARTFPGAQLETLSTAADLNRSFSRLYARARLVEGKHTWVALGVNAGETSSTIDGILTYALIWYAWNRERYPQRLWAGLRLFLPAGHTHTTANRLAYFDRRQGRVELFAANQEEFSCERLDERDFGNVETELAPARRAGEFLTRTAGSAAWAVQRIRRMASKEIELVALSHRHELSLRLRGLEFARAENGRVRFGIDREEEELTEANFGKLAALIERLRGERVPDGTPASSIYRLDPERWLESMVFRAPDIIDPRLERERLYRQVPAVARGERVVADLLGAGSQGQLLVIELKVSTDIHLPLQGLDYWLRVRWHQQRGEFSQCGYFSGLELESRPPELLLVAPSLEFHSTTEIIVGYLSPEVPVELVGLNQDWRRKLQVVFRRSPARR